MDREATKQMYNQVLQQIQAGDPMAAYSIFEQMPFPDQMAMYVMPGVGDAIAAVEAGVYNQRSKDNFAQGNIGSGLMDAGIGGLAMASTIPFLGKAAEIGNMGLKGARSGFNTLRSMRGDGMPGGGGGRSRIDELNAEKKELIKDHEAMTERMPKDEARKYYPNDEIDAIDEQIYDLMSGSRGQSTSKIFRGEGIVSAENKVDAEIGRLIDQGFEGDNFMYNQDFSVPVKMQARNRKTGEMIELETIPSQDGSIGVSITKLDDPMKPGSTADLERQRMSRLTESERTNIPKVQEMIQKERNLVAANNKEQIANRIRRELELEGGDMAPATRKRLESKLNTLMREITTLRGNGT